MYREILLLIWDYISALGKKTLIVEWLLPFIISGLGALWTMWIKEDVFYIVIENSVNVIATLLGFTLAALTLFMTGNANIEETKKYMTNKKVRGKSISLYRQIIISYSYLIVVEAFLCICFYVGSLFPGMVSCKIALVLNGIYILLLLHVLLVTVRTIKDLYFILIKNDR